MQREDSELIRDYLESKDELHFRYIVERYSKTIFNYISRLGHFGENTEDVVQETFLKVWKNLAKFDQKKNFKTWLFTIARNSAIDYLRKRKNIAMSSIVDSDGESFFEENIKDMEPLPDQIVANENDKKYIGKIIEELPPIYAESLLLHYIQDLTFEEMGVVLKAPMNTVKSRHRRALELLRKKLKDFL